MIKRKKKYTRSPYISEGSVATLTEVFLRYLKERTDNINVEH